MNGQKEFESSGLHWESRVLHVQGEAVFASIRGVVIGPFVKPVDTLTVENPLTMEVRGEEEFWLA